MGYYSYCNRCDSPISAPTIQECRQGYVQCNTCGERWDDINQVDILFDIVDDLQKQIDNLKRLIYE